MSGGPGVSRLRAQGCSVGYLASQEHWPQPGSAARETEGLKDIGTSLDIPLDEVCLFVWDAEEASQEES